MIRAAGRCTLTLLVLVGASCAQHRIDALFGDTVTLPHDLAQVLRNYETAWRNKDAEALAALFAEDAFVLPNGAPPVRGRENIERHYGGAGGPLYLTALAWAQEGSTGYIIGEYSHDSDPAKSGGGKFTLTLVRDPARLLSSNTEHWLIMSDMDNGNIRPKRD